MPAFYDPLQFPWLVRLRDAWREVRNEALRLTASKLMPYPVGEIFEGTWNVCALKSPTYPGYTHAQMQPLLAYNRRLCPVTTELIYDVPGCELASFSILEPGCEIRPHRHDEGKLIAHLGLAVPGGCAITVDGETRTWAEGELLCFHEESLHSAYNRGNERRIVFLLDFAR